MTQASKKATGRPCEYEVRVDNPVNPSEYAVFAEREGQHSRRVVLTPNRDEAYGMAAWFELRAACEAAERMLGCTDDNDLCGLRSALAKCQAAASK